MDFLVNAPVVIFSSDSRSLFKNTLHVKMQEIVAPDFDKVNQVLADNDTMAELRCFMLAMQLMQTDVEDINKADLLVAKVYGTGDETMEYVQKYFIEQR